jgi:Asp-tRNA(Asn)/Glu-tRNA(Gln) amidotransferase A subunit family amidase
MEEAEGEVQTVTRAARDRLEAAGAVLRAADLPGSFSRVHEMHRRVMCAEAAMHHRETFPCRRAAYAPGLASLLDEGRGLAAPYYAEALRHQLVFRREILRAFDGVDALLTPATPTAAPARTDTTGNPKFNVPWSYSGLPAITIPCAVTRAGMPLGLQLVGRPLAEAPLLSVAAWCERILAFDTEPLVLDGDWGPD